MNTEHKQQVGGLAVICDPHGRVKRVVHDEIGFFDKKAEDELIFSFIHPGSYSKLKQLLAKIVDNGIACDWEIHQQEAENNGVLVFYGIQRGKDILLLASNTRWETEEYLGKLMKINNEYANDLRGYIKENEQQRKNIDTHLYEEMSKLNNELTNTRRQLEKKTVELNRNIEQKNKMLGMAAHDLRNPLSIIQGFSEVLITDHQQQGNLTEQQLKFIKEINNSSKSMVRIIEDMLDISAIESGIVKIDPEECDVVSLIDRIVSLNRVKAENKGVSLVTDLPEHAIIIKIDPYKFEQVLNNLINNAVHYSHPDTTTTVGIQENPFEKGILLFVEDQGQGIPEKDQQKLFQPFARLSVKSTAGEKSTGLGLAIAKKIIEAHGGTISVDSKVGKGTKFSIRLPVV